MKSWALLLAVLTWVAAALTAQGADKEKEAAFAKVELKGRFRIEPLPPKPGRPVVIVGMDDYQLDVSRVRPKTDVYGLKKYDEKTVLVKGTLQWQTRTYRNVQVRELVIVVSSIDEADAK
jgi:hypothetical protein